MTDPTTVSDGYAGDDSDFRNAKLDCEGDLRMEYFTNTVPAASATSSTHGLVPFRKGASFVQAASQFYVADLDSATDVTINFGYIYDNDGSFTSDVNAFATLLTTAQSGGLITFDEHIGLAWVAEGDGWLIMEIQGGATTTEGVIKGQAVLTYDSA